MDDHANSRPHHARARLLRRAERVHSSPMLTHVLRAPAYPVLLVVGGQAFAARSRQRLSTLLARLCGPGTPEPELILDSRWWLFMYVPESHALLPSLLQHNVPSKLQLIECINARSNRAFESVPYPTTSLGSRSRERVFRDLVGILCSD